MSTGRELTLWYQGQMFACVQEKGIKSEREGVDRTNDDSKGFREFDPEVATRGLALSFSGVGEAGVMRDLGFSTGTNIMLNNIQVKHNGNVIIAGKFCFENYEESGSHNDALKFSTEFKSTGSWTYTPLPRNKKIVVFGSSVAAGTGATGNNGWANRLSTALAGNYTLVNKSVGGDTTGLLINRFAADVIPENPGIVIIGLSLANEGLHSNPNKTAVYNQYLNGIKTLIEMCKDQGYLVCVAGVYPLNDYTGLEYSFLKQADNELSRLSVPYFGFLGAVDDGSGHWRTGLSADAGHPNDAGHECLFKSIDLTIFDRAENYRSIPAGAHQKYFKMIMPVSVGAIPLNYIPATSMTSLTCLFKVRKAVSSLTGQPICALNGSSTAPLRVRNFGTTDAFLQIAGTVSGADGARIISTANTLDHIERWVAVVLDHDTATVRFYVDGTFVGSATVDALGAVSSISFGGRPDDLGFSAAGYEYSQLMIWRTALRSDQITSSMQGNVFMGSLVLCTPLQQAFAKAGGKLVNLAPSTTGLLLGVTPQLSFVA